MIAHTYIPQPPLVDFIELMWIYEGYEVPHTYESLLPTGTTTLVINFALREATLCGAHSVPFQLETARMVSHIGVHFRPGGHFLSLPCLSTSYRIKLFRLIRYGEPQSTVCAIAY